MMKKALFILLALMLWPGVARSEIQVVTTVPTLAAIAREIGGAHVSVSSMALATQDPHFVDAKPSLTLKLSKADLLLLVGLDLEKGWLPTLLTGSRNGHIQPGSRGYLDCSAVVRLMDQAKVVDRSHGDIHPGGNPHYLFDPRQLEHVAIAVAARLGELDGEHAAAYNDRLASFLAELHKLRLELHKTMQSHRGTAVIAYHKSWIYLSDWLGLKEIAYLEPKPGIPPSPGHVASVLKTARRHGAKLVMQESFYPDTTAKLIASKAGAALVVLPGGVDFERGQTVAAHIRELVARIEKGLR
jgi:zinc/manganese transport system substrate-binding protein